MPAFQPADNLRSRTFLGLLVAQFLAAFNDQAIHASAMFFAIKNKTLTEADAISLMPILFYAPWALFCTLAGWLADRFSKRNSLVFWKVAEIGITLIALAGFWLGSAGHTLLGPCLVLSTVFLMGTHSAFFVPAKYGAMPEILTARMLSRGNGLLESLSFLAVILGTVCGGVLSFVFKDREYFIGFVLVTLAVIGAVASLLIQKMPAANPNRPFPANLFQPLFANLRTMFRSRPLTLALLGIAFFTFMVAFMRGATYMHGETRNPRWDELETSLVVGSVALGVGLGSPLAGWLSGRKIELGLVPLGASGMVISLVVAALTLDSKAALVGCLIAIGFFTGFYIVPLFTLFQLRAPKTSKGDLLATSNFVNVVGAIAASVLFKVLVVGAAWIGITPAVAPKEVARGTLEELDYDDHGRPNRLEVARGDERPFLRSSRKGEATNEGEATDRTIIEQEGKPEVGDAVVVGRYEMTREGKPVVYYRVQPADDPLKPAYNKEPLTRYLFLGAAAMTLCTLLLLCRELPDLFARSLLWLRWRRRRLRLEVSGLGHLPQSGPVVLATNCAGLEGCMQVLSATDRFTRFVLADGEGSPPLSPFLRLVAWRNSLAVLRANTTEAEWERLTRRADRALARGQVVGLPLEDGDAAQPAAKLLEELGPPRSAAVVPVYRETNGNRTVHIVVGEPLPPETSAAEVRRALDDLAHGWRERPRDGSALLAEAH
jgi:MFS family permease